MFMFQSGYKPVNITALGFGNINGFILELYDNIDIVIVYF